MLTNHLPLKHSVASGFNIEQINKYNEPTLSLMKGIYDGNVNVNIAFIKW